MATFPVFESHPGTPGAPDAGIADLAEHVRTGIVAVGTNQGGGTGTVWSADGLVITNHHVVPSNRVGVEFRDGRAAEGTVVARDPEADLAAVRVPFDGLNRLGSRDSGPPRVGELVFAAGNPWGERWVVTAGVVLAAGKRAIHADVRLAPGNSGGPLVDARGRVVGINAMIAGGAAVAIPAAVVQSFVETLDSRPRGAIGVTFAAVELPPGVAAAHGLSGGRGLMLTGIEPASPAERAGLLPGDVILAVDGASGLRDASRRLQAMRSGTLVRLTLLRGGQTLDVDALPVAAAA